MYILIVLSLENQFYLMIRKRNVVKVGWWAAESEKLSFALCLLGTRALGP